MYPESSNKQSKILLKHLANNEGIIYDEYLSKKIYFREEDKARYHEIDFWKKYDTLYGLLYNLLTSKITIDNANVDQITFII